MEPTWRVRLIRMHLEFWDRVGLREQEVMIGRRRDSGAPLGGRDEFDDPRARTWIRRATGFRSTAHIRLAARQARGARCCAASWNYQRGFDKAGQLDQGLIFAAFNQDPERQFITRPEAARRRADDRLHHPRRRRVLLRPARARKHAGDWVGSGLFFRPT